MYSSLRILSTVLIAILPLWRFGPAHAGPLFPTWLWNAPAQWAFSPDQLKLDHQMNGYRVWCWQSYRNPENYFGLYTRADLQVKDLNFSRLSGLNADSCKALIRAYGRGG